jgi:proteic killer suppression protein
MRLRMVAGFRHKGLEAFYDLARRRGLSLPTPEKRARILGLLDVAAAPADLHPPGFRLRSLKGNWRVTFRFVGADVELIDYQDYR